MAALLANSVTQGCLSKAVPDCRRAMDTESAFEKSGTYYASRVYECHHSGFEEAWVYRILVGVRSR